MSKRSESADNLVVEKVDVDEEEVFYEDDEDEDEEEESLEEVFKDCEVPPWSKQITYRAIITGGVLSFVFNVINCKLYLTTGVIPYLNVAAGLLGYFYISLYTTLLRKFGLLKQPFTRQENTVVQTCVVASSGIAFSSGTASYLLGMSPVIATQTDGGNTPINVKILSLGWMYPYLFVVSFVGLFSIVPLRKIMILKYRLTYPTGTATAYLINSFHTPRGAKQATKQVAVLFKASSGSFLWAGFQWFFASHDNCGFSNFPTFGLKAFQQRFYFDFSSTYIGVGMICPYMVNISLLVGAIISWGIAWPLIEKKKGIWYSAELYDSDFHGMQGYRVFLAIATMFGDGIFHVVYMVIVTATSFIKQMSDAVSSENLPMNYSQFSDEDGDNYDDKRRTEFFLKDQIPGWFAVGGYVVLATLSIIVVPIIFEQRIKWYHILVAYIIAPVLAFCNAYGCGLTDLSLASNYGKIAILIFSSWVGTRDGGVIAGLAACGVMMNIVSTASDLMQDFKTGYMTLSSPRSMFLSQVLGTAMGCAITPTVFWFFYKAYNVGDPTGFYPAPYGQMYRAIAVVGVEGLSALPKHCLQLAILCFCSSIVINIISMMLKKVDTKYRIYRFIPSPMCMAIPFYLGGYFAIDMCVGSLIMFIWNLKSERKAESYAPAVASGLICGDSLWGVPAALLAIAKIKAPICMTFISNEQYAKVQNIITGN